METINALINKLPAMILLVNDQPLYGVNSLIIKDFKDVTGSFTRITLNKIIDYSPEGLTELMRTQRFSFKLMDYETASGWMALDAELETYEMTLSTDDFLLHQKLVVKTPSFVFMDNISAKHLAAKEEEDLQNLIEILKKNQEAAKKSEGFIKNDIPSTVLPEEHLIDEHAILEELGVGERVMKAAKVARSSIKKDKKKKNKKI